MISMSNIIKYQPQLPLVVQRQLGRQSQRMSYITKLAIEALGEQSNVYGAAVIKVFQTMSAIAMLKQTVVKTGMSQQTEELFQKLTVDYLEAMARIPQRSSEMIYQVLERASVPEDDGESLGTLLDAFIGWLNE
jgi:hypothetical protein